MPTKNIGYPEPNYDIITELSKLLTKKRGIKVSLSAASSEASKRMLDEEKKK